MKIMLDTNVLISILVFNSKLLKDMLVKITENYTLVLSSFIVEELREVISVKFPNKIDDLNIFLYNLPYKMCNISKFYKCNLNVNIRDKNDIPVILSALLSKVDILITGDRDFENLNISNLEILTPSKFMSKY